MNEKIVLYFSKKKARNKMYWLLFYATIMLIAAIIISEGDNKKIVFGLAIVFSIMNLPQLIIHFNYLKHDKKKRIIFDYKNDIFQEFIDGKLKTEIKINDIKKIATNAIV